MKKILLLTLLVIGSLSSNIYGGDIYLTKTSSKKVNTLDANYAFTVQTAWVQNIYAHRAFYYVEGMGNITVATVIKDNSGLTQVGHQYVVYSTYPFDMISTSNKKSYQKVNGIEYIVYDHGDFKVYSTEKTQFYIIK